MNLRRTVKAGVVGAVSRGLAIPVGIAGGEARFPESPERILILKPCCLGDVLMATPVVRALRERFPKATIDFAVGQFARQMVESNPHIDAVLDCGRIGWGKRYPASDLFQFVKTVRRRQYDVCFVLDRSPSTATIPFLARIPIRVGLDSGGRGFSLTHKTSVLPVRHEADLYLDTLRAAGIEVREPRMEFFPMDEDRRLAGLRLRRLRHGPPSKSRAPSRETETLADEAVPITRRPNPIISGPLGRADGGENEPTSGWEGLVVALHPAGGENPGMSFVAKRWTPQGYAAVADAIVSGGGSVVLVGSSAERAVTRRVGDLMNSSSSRLLDLAGETTLPQLGAVLEACDGFVGNDTGPMHLACAVGTPTVAVFGPSNPVMYRPYSPYGELVYEKVYCSPCLKDGRYQFASDCVHQCMTGVAPELVLAALTRAVEAKRSAPVEAER